jgi:hypothetical protein
LRESRETGPLARSENQSLFWRVEKEEESYRRGWKTENVCLERINFCGGEYLFVAGDKETTAHRVASSHFPSTNTAVFSFSAARRAPFYFRGARIKSSARPSVVMIHLL